MRLIATYYSNYEIDEDAQLIRRVSGQNDPTDAFEENGKWHQYADLSTRGGHLVIQWPEGAKEHTHTITSLVFEDKVTA